MKRFAVYVDHGRLSAVKLPKSSMYEAGNRKVGKALGQYNAENWMIVCARSENRAKFVGEFSGIGRQLSKNQKQKARRLKQQAAQDAFTQTHGRDGLTFPALDRALGYAVLTK